ncbi:hypothetical protein ACX93W_05375 [Paenibacillus sp. CAU 1782]
MATSTTKRGRQDALKWKLTPSESESWDSYEWLIRQKMDSLEHLIREFSNDVRIIAGPRRKEEIDSLVAALVTDLWNNVAEIGTEKVKATIGAARTFNTSSVFSGKGDIIVSSENKITPDLYNAQIKLGKSNREIAEMCGVKPESIYGYLYAWRKKGLIE